MEKTVLLHKCMYLKSLGIAANPFFLFYVTSTTKKGSPIISLPYLNAAIKGPLYGDCQTSAIVLHGTYSAGLVWSDQAKLASYLHFFSY